MTKIEESNDCFKKKAVVEKIDQNSSKNMVKILL